MGDTVSLAARSLGMTTPLLQAMSPLRTAADARRWGGGGASGAAGSGGARRMPKINFVAAVNGVAAVGDGAATPLPSVAGAAQSSSSSPAMAVSDGGVAGPVAMLPAPSSAPSPPALAGLQVDAAGDDNDRDGGNASSQHSGAGAGLPMIRRPYMFDAWLGDMPSPLSPPPVHHPHPSSSSSSSTQQQGAEPDTTMMLPPGMLRKRGRHDNDAGASGTSSDGLGAATAASAAASASSTAAADSEHRPISPTPTRRMHAQPPIPGRRLTPASASRLGIVPRGVDPEYLSGGDGGGTGGPGAPTAAALVIDSSAAASAGEGAEVDDHGSPRSHRSASTTSTAANTPKKQRVARPVFKALANKHHRLLFAGGGGGSGGSVNGMATATPSRFRPGAGSASASVSAAFIHAGSQTAPTALRPSLTGSASAAASSGVDGRGGNSYARHMNDDEEDDISLGSDEDDNGDDGSSVYSSATGERLRGFGLSRSAASSVISGDRQERRTTASAPARNSSGSGSGQASCGPIDTSRLTARQVESVAGKMGSPRAQALQRLGSMGTGSGSGRGGGSPAGGRPGSSLRPGAAARAAAGGALSPSPPSPTLPPSSSSSLSPTFGLSSPPRVRGTGIYTNGITTASPSSPSAAAASSSTASAGGGGAVAEVGFGSPGGGSVVSAGHDAESVASTILAVGAGRTPVRTAAAGTAAVLASTASRLANILSPRRDADAAGAFSAFRNGAATTTGLPSVTRRPEDVSSSSSSTAPSEAAALGAATLKQQNPCRDGDDDEAGGGTSGSSAAVASPPRVTRSRAAAMCATAEVAPTSSSSSSSSLGSSAATAATDKDTSPMPTHYRASSTSAATASAAASDGIDGGGRSRPLNRSLDSVFGAEAVSFMTSSPFRKAGDTASGSTVVASGSITVPLPVSGAPSAITFTWSSASSSSSSGGGGGTQGEPESEAAASQPDMQPGQQFNVGTAIDTGLAGGRSPISVITFAQYATHHPQLHQKKLANAALTAASADAEGAGLGSDTGRVEGDGSATGEAGRVEYDAEGNPLPHLFFEPPPDLSVRTRRQRHQGDLQLQSHNPSAKIARMSEAGQRVRVTFAASPRPGTAPSLSSAAAASGVVDALLLAPPLLAGDTTSTATGTSYPDALDGDHENDDDDMSDAAAVLDGGAGNAPSSSSASAASAAASAFAALAQSAASSSSSSCAQSSPELLATVDSRIRNFDDDDDGDDYDNRDDDIDGDEDESSVESDDGSGRRSSSGVRRGKAKHDANKRRRLVVDENCGPIGSSNAGHDDDDDDDGNRLMGSVSAIRTTTGGDAASASSTAVAALSSSSSSPSSSTASGRSIGSGGVGGGVTGRTAAMMAAAAASAASSSTPSSAAPSQPLPSASSARAILARSQAAQSSATAALARAAGSSSAGASPASSSSSAATTAAAAAAAMSMGTSGRARQAALGREVVAAADVIVEQSKKRKIEEDEYQAALNGPTPLMQPKYYVDARVPADFPAVPSQAERYSDPRAYEVKRALRQLYDTFSVVDVQTAIKRNTLGCLGLAGRDVGSAVVWSDAEPPTSSLPDGGVAASSSSSSSPSSEAAASSSPAGATASSSTSISAPRTGSHGTIARAQELLTVALTPSYLAELEALTGHKMDEARFGTIASIAPHAFHVCRGRVDGKGVLLDRSQDLVRARMPTAGDAAAGSSGGNSGEVPAAAVPTVWTTGNGGSWTIIIDVNTEWPSMDDVVDRGAAAAFLRRETDGGRLPVGTMRRAVSSMADHRKAAFKQRLWELSGGGTSIEFLKNLRNILPPIPKVIAPVVHVPGHAAASSSTAAPVSSSSAASGAARDLRLVTDDDIEAFKLTSYGKMCKGLSREALVNLIVKEREQAAAAAKRKAALANGGAGGSTVGSAAGRASAAIGTRTGNIFGSHAQSRQQPSSMKGVSGMR